MLAGNAGLILKQTASVLATASCAFGFSYAALWLIIGFTPVRVTETEERHGLDQSLHGEVAYEQT